MELIILTQQIFKINIKSSDYANCTGLSTDWLTGNIYYTDADAGTISVMNGEGRYPATLIDGLDQPSALEVNPLNGSVWQRQHLNNAIVLQ